MTLGRLFFPNRVKQELTDVEITSVVRKVDHVKKGSVFVLTRSDDACGISARQALSRGAAAVVSERDTGQPQQVLVPDAQRAYARLCAAYFGNPERRLRLIGVTGTNGKTTTAHMIRHILREAGERAGLIGTVGCHTGKEFIPAVNTTPDAWELHSLFARMVRENCGFAVLEVSSHALSQGRVDACRFDAGVFTNLTQDHLDYHKTMEEYGRAKGKLFARSFLAVLNADDEWSEKIGNAHLFDRVTYSAFPGNADLCAEILEESADGERFRLISPQGTGEIFLPVPGRFSVSNALAAAACTLSLGVGLGTVCGALSGFGGVPGRMEKIETGRGFSVVIDYAHTPDGLSKALGALHPAGRRIAVFGCGGDRDRTKRAEMGRMVAQSAEYAIITSDNPRSEDPGAIIADIIPGMKNSGCEYAVVEDRREAIFRAIAEAAPGDVILLAGKGHETCQILARGKVPFDERQIVAEALEALPGKTGRENRHEEGSV